MTGPRQAQLLAATDLLLDARRTATPIPELPASLRPTSDAEAAYIQDQLIQSFGDVGGWKVGPSGTSPDAPPTCAPMPRAWIAPNAATLSAPHFRFRGVEAELAFLLGSDLPPRAASITTPYTLTDITAAIASCHPAIEILESGLTDPVTADPFSRAADLQMHGGFVFGPACPDWRKIDFAHESVTLAIDSSIRAERPASDSAKMEPDFFLNLLLALANQGSARTGGLHAGQWITTGSWTGLTFATAGTSVDAHFTTLGRVSLSFA